MEFVWSKENKDVDLTTSNIVHAGRLYRFKEESLLYDGHWKECWMVLMKNGTLFWFNNKQCHKQLGVLNGPRVVHRIKMAEIAVRRFKQETPICPYPNNHLYIVLPHTTDGSRSHDPMAAHWFCAKGEQDLEEWVIAFSRMLHKEHLVEMLKPKIIARANWQKAALQGNGIRNVAAALKKKSVFRWGELWDEIVRYKLVDDTESKHDSVTVQEYVEAMPREPQQPEKFKDHMDIRPSDSGYDELMLRNGSDDSERKSSSGSSSSTSNSSKTPIGEEVPIYAEINKPSSIKPVRQLSSDAERKKSVHFEQELDAAVQLRAQYLETSYGENVGFPKTNSDPIYDDVILTPATTPLESAPMEFSTMETDDSIDDVFHDVFSSLEESGEASKRPIIAVKNKNSPRDSTSSSKDNSELVGALAGIRNIQLAAGGQKIDDESEGEEVILHIRMPDKDLSHEAVIINRTDSQNDLQQIDHVPVVTKVITTSSVNGGNGGRITEIVHNHQTSTDGGGKTTYRVEKSTISTHRIINRKMVSSSTKTSTHQITRPTELSNTAAGVDDSWEMTI